MCVVIYTYYVQKWASCVQKWAIVYKIGLMCIKNKVPCLICFTWYLVLLFAYTVGTCTVGTCTVGTALALLLIPKTLLHTLSTVGNALALNATKQ